MKKLSSLFIVALFLLNLYAEEKEPKIVALLQVRNEEIVIRSCLRALAHYVDAFVVLDDFSQDNTVKILHSLQKNELNIETILYNDASAWQVKTEHYNRQQLLEAGRKIGGTHFVFIDADEMFVSTCMDNQWLRKKILALKKGQVLKVPWITLWGSPFFYRADKEYHPLRSRLVPVAFCDDGSAHYNQNPSGSKSGIIHVSCIPSNLRRARGIPPFVEFRDITKGLLHFKWANFAMVDTKRVWYMCLELLRLNEKTPVDEFKNNAQKLNSFYRDKEFHGTFPDQRTKVPVKKLFPNAYKNYPFFKPSTYKKYNPARKLEVLAWFERFGKSYFYDLAIRDVLWVKSAR